MAIKKSDLYSSLWKSCDELRGGMDASQYKDYVLTLLFLKYVSDKNEANPDSLIEIPPGCSFDDIVALKGSKEIGEGIDKIVAQLADANDLRGVIDVAFFNDDEKLGKGQEMVDRLSKLVTIFKQLDFRATRAEGDDLLGDAYEYLMRHFATESGKSKGQFYTPAEVSRILAKVVGIGPAARKDQTIYDPTCGSGSLLLKAAAQAPYGLTVYGQEKDGATWALARMNMILHGYETAEIAKGDTITSPAFASGNQLKPHDFIVANPPFSTKSWSSGISPETDEYGRFRLGVPPTKNGDYAFLLHAIRSLRSTGKAAVILPHGVLFRGNVEATIRRNLLKRGLIKGVIGLPANLFYGTGIPACVVVVDKEAAGERDGVFLIDASKGFIKEGNKNRLRSQDIHKIVDVFRSQAEIERYSRLVPLAEIADERNDYNLNIPRYIDSSEPEDIQDLDAHLNGGIPNRDLDLLSGYWEALPSLRDQLFEPERPSYSRAKVEPDEVQETIETNDDQQAFQQQVTETFNGWWEAHRERLKSIEKDTAPKAIIDEVSEDLLKRFRGVPLLDAYDVYEQLMSYWDETMHDDVFLVSGEGWIEAARPRGLREIGRQSNGKPKFEHPDLVVGSGKSAQRYKLDLIPPEFVIEQYFAVEKKVLDEASLALEQASEAVEAYVEEHGVEAGLLEDVVGDNGKVAKKAVADQIKTLKGQVGLEDELGAAQRCKELLEAEAAAKKALNVLETEIGEKTFAKYDELTDTDIRQFVLDKWRRSVWARVDSVGAAKIWSLADRIELLEARYAERLGDLQELVDDLNTGVTQVLARMGVSA
jgi:type I restriction enzyme M protein